MSMRSQALERLHRAIARQGGVKYVAQEAGLAWQHVDNVLQARRPLGLGAFRALRRIVLLPDRVWLQILDPGPRQQA